ncbi:Uncharacterized protein PCOAH_00023250 [Plasmodium coatneyi]|uniref:Sulfhydryl oxidase n=1 Tax=Plasmodium coatneyi TaxID=208452 RepID=A0A1B1DY31_9APIC|nr:Uncharacterized protein PCOAH_00023250 [Plasmodium coatneyi]ANQ07668.1 Uncharacterized protein PCOAH_00023250 [Plasmodium coatneyi]
MGNQVASKVFYKNNDKKENVVEEIKHYEDENKKRENGRFPPGELPKGEKWQQTDEQAKQGLSQTAAQNSSEEHLKNNEIEKIKQENFYMFDESLNSNDVKHPCHAQWFLFWVFASYLNEKFSDTEREYVHSFYSNFPEQCIKGKGKNCFLEFSKIYPVRAGTREELMTWLQMCENYCRQKADLPVKIFSYKKLLKRWRYDDDYI